MWTNNHYLECSWREITLVQVLVIRQLHKYCQCARTRTPSKLWRDMYMGLCLVKRLHYPNQNRNINSGTYPFGAFRFFSFIHLSLDVCVHFSFFPFHSRDFGLNKLLFDLCRLPLCLLYHLHIPNTMPTFLLRLFTNCKWYCGFSSFGHYIQTFAHIRSFSKTSHLILWLISFGFICDFTFEPNIGKPNEKPQKILPHHV